MSYTPEQIKAAKDAISIIAGACNPKGIAKALDRAYCAEEDTKAAATSPAAMLMLHQLVYLASHHGAKVCSDIDESPGAFTKWLDECERRIAQEVNDHVKETIK